MLRHKILALTFGVVRRAICVATRSLLQIIILELLASNFQNLFLNNTKTIYEHLNKISRMVSIQRKKVNELVGRPSYNQICLFYT